MNQMEGEMYSFFKVWASVLVSQSYCCMVGKFVPRGLWRLVSRLPVMCLFFLLPPCLESVNLSGPTGFFISWLGNFKLLLFAFGKGPLATEKTLCSLPHFIAIACLPIKVQQKLARDGHKDKLPGEETGRTTFRNYIVKAALLAAMIRVYDFHGRIHPTVIYFLYCFHMYFAMEIILAVPAAAVRAAFGMELEPQFNDPHLSTSLQDFWSRRWNLMVPSILRPSVYEPVRCAVVCITGQRWAPLPAGLAVFLISGLMHELMFYYLEPTPRPPAPARDIIGFFLLHGVCLVAEVVVKKVVAGRWQLLRLLSRVLTGGFMIATGLRWFLPPLLRMKVHRRALNEYGAAAAFIRDAARAVLSPSEFQPLKPG